MCIRDRLYNTNRNNIGEDPIEIMDFEVTGGTTNVNVIITNDTPGTLDPIRFKYIFFRGTGVTFNEFEQGTSTVVGQANADGAIAVGAVLYLNTPTFGVEPTAASFSSRGGTLIDGVDRQKPDICAPNGVNTTVDLGGVGDFDNDGFPNFSGTSASAPHVAGAAALIVEGRRKYIDEETSPEEFRTLIQETAIDMNVPGYDEVSGFGFLQAQEVLLDIANPIPALMSYELPDGLDSASIGSTSFEIVINGRFITDSTVVMFGDQMLETTVLGDTSVSAIVPTLSLIHISEPTRPY